MQQLFIDEAGRVLIPAEVREQLGLSPTVALQLTVENGRIVLAPPGIEPRMHRINGVLVVDTELLADPDHVLNEVREERVRKLSGL